MSLHITETEYEVYRARVTGAPTPRPAQPSKYRAVRVTIDGHTFASKLEGQVYCDLKWQYLAGLISEPLLQVPFSLGAHYGRERVYIADFAYCNLKNGCLVVADAKGYATAEYVRKKRVFEALYGICITEYHRR